ncbi:MAG TPA: hypothetical protein V6C50_09295, partial [Crinalium sp.]
MLNRHGDDRFAASNHNERVGWYELLDLTPVVATQFFITCGGVVMKFNCSINRLCLSVSLAVSAIACGQLAVQAETTNPVAEAPMLQTADTIRLTSKPMLPEAASFSSAAVTSQETTAVLSTALEPAAPVVNQPANLSSVDQSQVETVASSVAATTPAVPAPGTVPTSAAALNLE